MSKITQDDINILKKVFVTKDDFKRFATKEDLKRFATKDDLKGFATKNDLARFATKDDLKNYATRADIVSFKDAILKEIRDMRDEVALVIGYKDQIEGHEDRIEKIEKHLHLPITP